MFWSVALSIGLLSGYSRSPMVIAIGATLIVPLYAAHVIIAGLDLLSASVVAAGAIVISNVGIVGGALAGLIGLPRD